MNTIFASYLVFMWLLGFGLAKINKYISVFVKIASNIY